MFSSIIALGIFTLAAATPITDNVSSSKGFTLRVQLANPAKDLKTSVKNTYLATIPLGSGSNLLVYSPTTDLARVFYANGTGPDNAAVNILSDEGSPVSPYNIALISDGSHKNMATAHLDLAPDNAGLYTMGESHHPALLPSNWLACTEAIAAFGGEQMTIFKQLFDTVHSIPRSCVQVNLLPECATLHGLPKDAVSSHRFARHVSCYKDASNVN